MRELIELDYLDQLSEKAKELLEKGLLNKEFTVDSFKEEGMEYLSKVIIDLTIANTQIRTFHFIINKENQVLFIDVQDDTGNTLVDVLLMLEDIPDNPKMRKIAEIIVAYKGGAIRKQAEDEEAAEEVALLEASENEDEEIEDEDFENVELDDDDEKLNDEELEYIEDLEDAEKEYEDKLIADEATHQSEKIKPIPSRTESTETKDEVESTIIEAAKEEAHKLAEQLSQQVVENIKKAENK